MAQFKRITRQEAIDYLNSNANYRELRQKFPHRTKAPEDLSTETMRGYVRELRKLAIKNEWAENMQPLRRHATSENVRQRGRRKGFENWKPAERIPRMFNEPIFFAAVDRHGHRIRKEARLTVTSGETVAVRALNRAITGKQQIAFTLTGPLPDQKRSIFWRGGYNPKLLLEAAGYHVTRTGRYAKIPGASLERWLINFLARMSNSPTSDRWPFIALYQIYAAETITEVDLVPQDHQRTYYLPIRRDLNEVPMEVAPTARPSWIKQHGRKG